MKVYDLSPLFETNMPRWFTHPDMAIIDDARNFDQNGYLAQTLVMSEHTGSHVDAPAHVLKSMQYATIEKYPADFLIGLYKKYNLAPFDFKPGDLVPLKAIKEVERKDGFTIKKDDIVLLNLGWDRYYRPESRDPQERAWWGRNQPGLSEEVCKYFSDAGIRAIGSDTSGCDDCVIDGVLKFNFGHMKYFLPNNILIMEGLQNLDKAPIVGIFIALPLRIKNGSGSPIRPILLG